jgi:hypothetical protein
LQELRLALGVGVQPEELGVAQLRVPGVHWQELGVARRSKNPKLSP